MTLPRFIALWSPAPGCGKSAVAGLLCAQAGYGLMPFATPIKEMAIALLLQAGYSPTIARKAVWEDKEAPLTYLPGKPTARHLLRTLGTEWGRNCIHSELWISVWESTARQAGYGIADDVRFPNEAAAVRRLGGELWAVTRPGYADDSGHASEAGLGDVEFDRVIVNDGSLLDLARQVQGICAGGSR